VFFSKSARENTLHLESLTTTWADREPLVKSVKGIGTLMKLHQHASLVPTTIVNGAVGISVTSLILDTHVLNVQLELSSILL
jgi:hypothetical protein